MSKIYARVKSELGYWGTRLNLMLMLGATYVASNGGQVQATVNSLVPEKWRSLAIAAIGLGSFLIVNAAVQSDRQKASGNA